MNKRNQITLAAVLLLSLSTAFCAVISFSLYQELAQKNFEINELTNSNVELQNQLSPLKPYLVTSLGVSIEPRNITYPHPHFTVDGVVFNIGNRTAYNARLDITAYYKSGVSAFNMSLPLGNLGKWQVAQESKIVATSDWIGNCTITPVWDDFS
jgi:ABC-type phosphate/phosphonate transport system substrate-binding protein